MVIKIRVECNGITVCNNTRANEISNLLSHLKYTKSYVDTVGQDQFFYLDTSTGTTEARPSEALYSEGFARRNILTDAGNVNKILIPLNLYNYFAALRNNLYLIIRANVLIRLGDDNNIIFRKETAPDSKVIITKFRLWCPKVILMA